MAAIAISSVVLAALQAGRLYFNIRTGANSLVTSIATGMMLFGLTAFLLPPAERNPAYELPVSAGAAATAGVFLLALLYLLDARVAGFQRTTLPLRPALASRPTLRSSILYAIWPAALLTSAAATLIGAHAGRVTDGFTSNMGVLGATLSVATFGRIPNAALAGLILGVTFFTFQEVGSWPAIAGGTLQSFVLPTLGYLAIGVIALTRNRP